MNLGVAIKEIYNCRTYKSKKLTESQIHTILIVAHHAPLTINFIPWCFVFLRKKKQNPFSNNLTKYLYEKQLDKFNFENEMYKFIKETNFVILMFNVYLANGVLVKENKLFNHANIQVIGATIQNMILKATNLGIGSLRICNIDINVKTIRKSLNKLIIKIKYRKYLKNWDYKGVLGFDFLITKDEIMSIEFNPHFQAFSPWLNTALKVKDLPSMQEMQIVAFDKDLPAHSKIDGILVLYSMISYIKGIWNKLEAILKKIHKINEINIFSVVGLLQNEEIQKNAFLLKENETQKKSKIVWIGIRESEIDEAKNFFFASITIFGSNRDNNYSFDKVTSYRIDYGKDNKEWCSFVSRIANMLIEKYTDIKFMGYYPEEMIEISKEIRERAICVNDSSITNILENKLYTKLWTSSFVPIIPFSTFLDTELDYKVFCQAFPNYKQFVLQGTFSCGGSGTWLIRDSDDLAQFAPESDEDHIVMVTPFIKSSISVNTHLIIYSNTVQYFPPSIQIIEHFEHRLCYDGGDFVAAKKIEKKVHDKIYQYSMKIGMRLSHIGYRGICGIDFLVSRNDVYFMEINPRFQSSTFLLNRALRKNGLSTLQEMNMDAFYNDIINDIPSSFDVSESFLGINYTPATFAKAHYLWKRSFHCPEVTAVIDDDIDWTLHMEFDTYLYKMVFGTNITCISPDGELRLYNGFYLAWGLDTEISWSEQPKRFKTAILNQGVYLSRASLKELQKKGGPNYKMFYALDLTIDNAICINAPFMVSFSELSPFEIDFDGKNYVLNYYDKKIAHIRVRTIDANANKLTKSGIPYYAIGYMGVDRLRIHARSGCHFKNKDIGCRFCGIESGSDYSLKDIKEVLDTYKKLPELNHFLVGGGSFDPSDDFQKIIQIVTYIQKVYKKNVYLMSIPPIDCSILSQLSEAGVTEISFNLEIYDREYAKKIMPGKGYIPLERYDAAFRTAVGIFGKNGNVRSALIVGLEPTESTIQGIEYLCQIGVSPILSLFKPDGELEDYLAPSSAEVLYIWETAEKICKKYQVPLGPSCHYCEDNILKITMNE